MRVAGILVFVLMVAFAWAADGAQAADGEQSPRGARRTETVAFVPTAARMQRAASRHPCYGRCRRRGGWEFALTIPVWVPGVSGSFASGGIEVETSPKVDEILDEFFDLTNELKFGFLGAFHARKGRWTLGIEGFGARLGTGLTFKLLDRRIVDGTIFALIVRPTAQYEFITKPVCLPGIGRGCFHTRAVAGARFYRVGFDVDIPFGINLEADENWIDPIVGLDLSLDIARRWNLTVQGDIGGFGVGSDFAWWLTTRLEWQFARRWTLIFGYAVLDVTYGDIGDFAWNVNLAGPVLGITFSF